MKPRSLFAELGNNMPMFEQTLLYMCRAISCNEFQKRTGINNDMRARFMVPEYYITFRNHVMAALVASTDKTVEVPNHVDYKHVKKALRNPMVAIALLKQLEKQKWCVYTDAEVHSTMDAVMPAMQKAAKMIAVSKLRFVTFYQQLEIPDIQQDLLVKAIQTIGWTFDSRPIAETILLGCKAMHNHAKNVAEYWSAKKRQLSTERDCNGRSTSRKVQIDKLAKISGLEESDQFEKIDRMLSFMSLKTKLQKTGRRKKLYRILTSEMCPEFTEWLRKHRVIKSSQTDRHLFEQDPSKYVVSGCSFVGFTPKQTTRLMRQLQGDVR